MTNEIQSMDSLSRDIQGLASGNLDMYSSFTGNDFDTQVKMFEAVSNSEPISDNLGKVIQLKDVVVQRVEMSDEDTGEVSEGARVILIDADGSPYHAISQGLLTSLKNLFLMAGEPKTWPAPVPVKVVQKQGKGKNRYFTIQVATGK